MNLGAEFEGDPAVSNRVVAVRPLGFAFVNEPWFVAGISLLLYLRSSLPHSGGLPPMVWLLPPREDFARIQGVATIYGIPVRVVEGITAHLAFDLEAS